MCLCLLALAVPATGQTGIEAHVVPRNGVPVLDINGAPTPPLIFFHNTDIPGPRSMRFLSEQATLAARTGVHLYSLCFRCTHTIDGEPDFGRDDEVLDTFIQADPQARFILRMFPGPHPSWRDWAAIPPEHFAQYADGSTGNISIASDLFWAEGDADLERFIRYLEDSPYDDRIIGYHVGGPQYEMFLDMYREKGPDYSPVNQRRFRKWIEGRYPTEEALRAAWGDTEVTFATAGIPTFEPGRFPMHGAAHDEVVQFFYDFSGEQAWVDFSQYCSDIVADRIIAWARLVKAVTEGKKLSVFFYGYTFELPGSFSGHYRLGRILRCPDVDVLVSPYSYHDRFAGGAGSFMSPVDSVAVHGKLWLNEDDTRTHLIELARVPSHFGLFDKQTSGMDESLGVLGRNLAAVLVHRAGTWWMDLVAEGAFNDEALWDLLDDIRPEFERVGLQPEPYRPDVAVLVDEHSKLYVKSDWDANYWDMCRLRDAVAKSGAAAGYYLLNDFLEDRVPPCRVYVFANAFWLTDEQITRIKTRLDNERATAIWVYAPGYLGPGGPNIQRAQQLTGIHLDSVNGRQGSTGTELLNGLSWGRNLLFSPRIVVDDPDATALGTFAGDGAVSACRKVHKAHQSVFLGDIGTTPELFRRLFRAAGVHIWTDRNEVIHTDGRVLAVHCATPGSRSIRLPEGVEAEPLYGATALQTGQDLQVENQAGDTLWFRLTAATPKERQTCPSPYAFTQRTQSCSSSGASRAFCSVRLSITALSSTGPSGSSVTSPMPPRRLRR